MTFRFRLCVKRCDSRDSELTLAGTVGIRKMLCNNKIELLNTCGLIAWALTPAATRLLILFELVGVAMR